MSTPAGLPSWVFGYALALGLVHAVVLYYLYRAIRTTSSTTASADEPVVDAERVVCDNCGAENETGYRYCRNCVEEIEGGVGALSAGNAPAGRGML